MSDHCKTMKEVVARLREDGVEALLEIFELDVAVGELTLSALGLAARLSEVAGELDQLAGSPPLASPARLRSLADSTRKASDGAQAQASILLELKHGLDAWSITPARVHPGAPG
jgi:hypothetical protein